MKSERKLNFGILGATGRMGHEVKALALLSGHKIVAELTSKNLSKYFNSKNSVKPDVWVDFSTPQALESFLDRVEKIPMPLVSGTTGLSDHQLTRLKKYAKKTSVFWAPNMSVGIALVMKMLEAYSSYSGFDFQIDEIHHRLKKDQPSGTAILLQNKLAKVLFKKNLPPPLSIRGGGVFGIHRIQAFSDEEIISIEHTALNRRVFAKGAIWAAQQMAKTKSGYYEMQDILKL